MTQDLVRKQQRGALKALKLSVTLRSSHRPFWSARYYDLNVFTEKKRIEKLKYIHRNPVTRGLANLPEDWAWSSFLHYADGIIGTVEIGVGVDSYPKGSCRYANPSPRIRKSGTRFVGGLIRAPLLPLRIFLIGWVNDKEKIN